VRLARLLRILRLLLAAFLLGLGVSGALATTRVHVRGTARIDARASRSSAPDGVASGAPRKLVLAGSLVDDASQPLAGERVTLSLALKTAPSVALGLPPYTPERCGEGPGPGPALERADALSLKTDAAGRFCVKLSLPVDVYVARLGFDANGNIDATRIELPVDLALRPLTLRFDPEPTVLHLEGPATVIEAIATTESEETGTSFPAQGLTLTLTNETGTVLGSATTNTSGHTRFAVLPQQLGDPGKGELRVAFAGNGEVGSSVHVAQVERHVRVALAAPEATDGRLPEGVPEDGAGIAVTAAATNGGGSVPTGTIEARIGDAIVGAAPLEAGKARVVVTFSTPLNEMPLSLHYSADAPWYEPESDLVLTLPVRGPSPWRRAPLVLAGLAVIAWLILGRASPTRARKSKTASPPHGPPIAGEARLEVVRELRGREGWTGRVFDAHDGTPVEGALVSIERPGFTGKERIAYAATDTLGAFRLEHFETREGDRLSVEGPLHAELAQPVPPSGELAIALVLRKRALLDRLVDWAKKRGKPFDGPPEPTPGHVRRTAGADFPVARWADAVERAAYSGTVVDAKAEAEVDRLAPPRGGVP
jgi:hypothetical protein